MPMPTMPGNRTFTSEIKGGKFLSGKGKISAAPRKFLLKQSCSGRRSFPILPFNSMNRARPTSRIRVRDARLDFLGPLLNTTKNKLLLPALHHQSPPPEAAFCYRNETLPGSRARSRLNFSRPTQRQNFNSFRRLGRLFSFVCW